MLPPSFLLPVLSERYLEVHGQAQDVESRNESNPYRKRQAEGDSRNVPAGQATAYPKDDVMHFCSPQQLGDILNNFCGNTHTAFGAHPLRKLV